MSDRTFLTLFALAGYIFAALFITVGFFARSKIRRLLKTGVITKGTVLGSASGVTMSSESISRVFFPVFAFKDAQGIEYQVRSGVGVGSETLKFGDVVEVLYNPQSPQEAVIDLKTYVKAWRAPLFAGSTAALVATGIIVVLLLKLV